MVVGKHPYILFFHIFDYLCATNAKTDFKMKKLLWIVLVIAGVSLSVSAQTQHGYVKTKGRLGSNGQVIAGTRLSGVIIQVKGRTPVVTKADGTFSFPIPANNFVIMSVKKSGYVLNDPEITSRQYTYSTNPLVLIMETPSQQTEDKLNNERRIRRNLQRQLQAKEEEIERLKEQNIISREEYQLRLQQLYTQQESNEKLISEMAERYSQLDYDQLDEFNLRISDCILNGRLTEADSLLRSKGDINDRIARYNKHHEANKEAQKTLDKSKSMEQKNLEDIAQDCLHYYEAFLLKHQVDSAGLYLELRANLDTTNLRWQYDAGIFIERYLADYQLSTSYLNRGLRQAISKYGKQGHWVAIFTSAIASIYMDQFDYRKAQEFYLRASTILEQVLGPNHPDIVNTWNYIGDTYRNLGEHDRALEYHLKALDIQEHHQDTKQYDIALTYYFLAATYKAKQDYDKAMAYFHKALDTWKQALGERHPNVALCHHEIGTVYHLQGKNDEAMECYNKAVDIQQEELGINHPHTAASYEDIGSIYIYQGNYDQALEYYLKSIKIREMTLGIESPKAGHLYGTIGDIYISMGNYDKALEFYFKSLPVWEKTNDDSFPYLAMIYIRIANAYTQQENDQKGLEYFMKALPILESKYGDSNQYTIIVYCGIGETNYNLGNYKEALDYCTKAYDGYVKMNGADYLDVQTLKEVIDKSREQLGL